ncbi:asparagine synthase (glutamine-hydrolyzing) [Swaminathania salitolerans]|uniref:asparagine synthase (glutamine-hydrolyzing) n=1 Tax=Swaminathania salitolerans TaxID=182838 RepID=A0A511BMV8_9PROT|nr:asparagine synthase (glutamine-hydrolyzing) [Swaminathania salitolerans]GBQ16121.1 asparagine synthetase [Swaminathania salitolerans LMG 21291]GEL01605.1 asparagine synthetase B [Swaminathania salitolerans]
MCGIAGIACLPGHRPDPAVLRRMADALRHRGPDGEGFHVTGAAALVHRRLSIVDLEGGAQPLLDGAVALVANGEIYNDPDLRRALPDAPFRTGSDCESPLYLWPGKGMEYTLALRGMYAIAILDSSGPQSVLTLSRDPFGIKPLYYGLGEAGVVFASEPGALLATGLFERRIRPDARDQLLQLQFTSGRETIYPGIMRVLPGETLRFVDGRLAGSRHQPGCSGRIVSSLSEDRALAKLDTALMDSVAAHERADVPFGMFLSGGIDSTAVLAAMTRLGGEAPLAWTARFDKGSVDESAQAASLARVLGARHEILTVTEAMVWRFLPQIVACLDDPVADYATIPTWFLARAARKDVTVILSGEGGDELFAGYGRYRKAMRPWWRGGRMPYRRGMLDGLCRLASGGSWRGDLAPGREETRLRAAQALDLKEWLPNDLLIKLDRCLMAHGIEGRTPLLDPAVATLAWSLPDELKIRGGTGKYLLRRWVSRHVPEATPFAPKQGFTVPVGDWIAARAASLGPLVARSRGLAGVVPPETIGKLFRDATGRRERHAAWVLLFYALWHRIHIETGPSDGDVFETLAASGP